ncbi:MAG: phosphatase PAP2 family protein [Sphingomonas sp. 28-62-20]|uniref:phosphatase PAP2 family protein n=1 Tax=Sphingomonas sp. 28-62-20 TaxID=1970433 RepID=UPI000BDB047D|nr:MAG: phosphatase PAP2 family protein [Sphingomonas sp. 28-62-20]
MPDPAPIDDIRHPPWLFYAAGALALAVLIIAVLGATIARGHQFAFDRAIMLAMREPENMRVPEGPTWLKQVMVDVTALGGETVLTIIVIITAGFLAIRRHWLTFWLVLGGTISGSWAVALIKTTVARPRPALIDHIVQVWSASFPSGHAANSAIIYLTVALLLMQIVESRIARWYMVAVAMLLVIVIGVSRIYLGVHWPSDVLAGWGFGTLWALAWWSLGGWIRLRRIESRRAQGVPVLP